MGSESGVRDGVCKLCVYVYPTIYIDINLAIPHITMTFDTNYFIINPWYMAQKHLHFEELNVFSFISIIATNRQNELMNCSVLEIGWSVAGPQVINEKTQAPKSSVSSQTYTEADGKGETRLPVSTFQPSHPWVAHPLWEIVIVLRAVIVGRAPRRKTLWTTFFSHKKV